MAKHVWMVSSGSYSDYSVSCVCPDQVTAEAVASHLNAHEKRLYDQYRIEEIPWVASVDDLRGKGRMYRVWVNGAGNETRHDDYELDGWEVPDHERSWELWGRDGEVCAESSRGYEVALKAARDKLAELKTQQHGV